MRDFRMRSSKMRTLRRCGKCKPCLTTSCGKCKHCSRMRMFGGDGTCKKACIQRGDCEEILRQKALNLLASSPYKSHNQAANKGPPATLSPRKPNPDENNIWNMTVQHSGGEVGNSTSYPTSIGRGDILTPRRDSNSSSTVTAGLGLDTSGMDSRGGSVLAPSSLRVDTAHEAPGADLPQLALHTMTKSELKEFIPKLLTLVTGRESAFYGRRSSRPEWWPHDVMWVNSMAAWLSQKYWTDSLRSVVTNCYRYMGREELLHGCMPDEQPESARLNVDKQSVSADGVPSPVKISRMFPKYLFLPYSAEFYICYFCEMEFVNKEMMRQHQKTCTLQPPQLVNMTAPPGPDPGSHPYITVDVARGVPDSKHRWSDVPIEQMVKALDLVGKQDALRLSKRKASQEIECTILEDLEPLSPVQSKVSSSLMSQCSRDESHSLSRKRLSYSLSVEAREVVETLDSSEDSDNESETMRAQQAPAPLNLLNIPISSLLGQRIKDHVTVESTVPVVSDTGSYCKTPVKNNFLEKLRKKETVYPYVYKPRRIANLHKQNHMYKFTKTQKKEFLTKLNTGLNMESYAKIKQMKRVRISVQKLSRRKLLQYVSRKHLDRIFKGKFKGLKASGYYFNDSYSETCEFPSGPSLLTPRIDKLLGLKRRSNQAKNSVQPLSLSNCVSEEMEAEVAKQKLTLYRSLLYEMSVLKPQVIMEDISCEYETSVSSDHKPTVQLEVKDKKTSEASAPKQQTASKRLLNKDQTVCAQKEKSVLRTMLLEGKAQRDEEVRQFFSKNKAGTRQASTRGNKDGSGDGAACEESSGGQLDDAVSIMSASSDSESLHSNCCTGCEEKKRGMMCSRTSPCSSRRHGPPSPSKSVFLEPLSVKVHEDLVADDSVFPSPVSVSSHSESPTPPRTKTPISSTYHLPTPPGARSDPKSGPDTPMSLSKEDVFISDGEDGGSVDVPLQTRSGLCIGVRSLPSTPATSPCKQAQSQSLRMSPRKRALFKEGSLLSPNTTSSKNLLTACADKLDESLKKSNQKHFIVKDKNMENTSSKPHLRVNSSGKDDQLRCKSTTTIGVITDKADTVLHTELKEPRIKHVSSEPTLRHTRRNSYRNSGQGYKCNKKEQLGEKVPHNIQGRSELERSEGMNDSPGAGGGRRMSTRTSSLIFTEQLQTMLKRSPVNLGKKMKSGPKSASVSDSASSPSSVQQGGLGPGARDQCVGTGKDGQQECTSQILTARQSSVEKCTNNETSESKSDSVKFIQKEKTRLIEQVTEPKLRRVNSSQSLRNTRRVNVSSDESGSIPQSSTLTQSVMKKSIQAGGTTTDISEQVKRPRRLSPSSSPVKRAKLDTAASSAAGSHMGSKGLKRCSTEPAIVTGKALLEAEKVQCIPRSLRSAGQKMSPRTRSSSSIVKPFYK